MVQVLIAAADTCTEEPGHPVITDLRKHCEWIKNPRSGCWLNRLDQVPIPDTSGWKVRSTLNNGSRARQPEGVFVAKN